MLVDIATVASQIGFCCVYFTFIAQNMALMINFGLSSFFKAQLAWMAIAGLLFIPLVWIRKMAYFTATNFISLLVILLSLLLILGSGFYQMKENGIGLGIHWGLGGNFLSFFGTSVYAFEGICMVPFIEQEMKEKEKFKPVLNGCMIAIVIIMGGTGALSYLAFGEAA